MSLNRLGRGDGAAMVERLAGNAALLPPDVIAEIVERTDGVPLFVEEMTKAVLEAGAERGREIAASVPSTGLGVPATLQASLMARLDRLGSAAKGVAQIGAAIGREFSYELAARSGNSPKKAPGSAPAPRRCWAVFQRGTPPDAATCSSTPWCRMPPTARCCAARDGNCMRASRERSKRHFPELMESQPELLAHHYAAAGYRTRRGSMAEGRSTCGRLAWRTSKQSAT